MYAHLPKGVDFTTLPYVAQARKQAPKLADVHFIVSTILTEQLENEGKPVPIYSAILQKFVRSYRAVLDNLTDAGYIAVHPYSGGYLWRSFGAVGECTRYSVCDELTALEVVRVKLPERFGRLLELHLKAERERAEVEAPWSTPLREALQGLRINYDKAHKFIENEHRCGVYSTEQFNARVVALSSFARLREGGTLPFSYRANCGRVFTPLTNLPGDLRQFLSTNDPREGNLVEVDVRCSQPYFLCAVMASEGRECDAMQDVTRGVFYDRVADFCNLTREGVKQPVLALIYDRNRSHKVEAWEPMKRALIALYPKLWEYITAFKDANDYKELALRMQRAEGALMLETVACEVVERYGCFVGTIHDSIVVPERYAEAVADLIRLRAFENYGVAPQVRRKLL